MDKVVFVKRIEKPKDRSGKAYLKITDQNNQEWSLFRYNIEPQLNKVYLFTFEKNAKGYNEVSEIRQLVNIFEEKAAKKLADINDIKREIGICLSYSVSMVNNGTLEMDKLFTKTDELYEYLNTKAESLIPK